MSWIRLLKETITNQNKQLTLSKQI